MEMTYGGALVMPSSYAMMDEEEMMYLEGGEAFYLAKDTCITISTYISQIVGIGKATLALTAISTLATLIAGKTSKIVDKITGINIYAKAIGLILVVAASVQVATFCNGVLGAYANGTGVSMEWKGVFTNKKYY